MTSWAHLPNAVHIDRVLASALANEYRWVQVRTEERGAAWHDAQSVAWNVAYANDEKGWYAAWAGMPTPAAALDAVLALIAYDDCAYMLDSDPGELAIVAKFGDHRAVMLLPACKVLHLLREIA